MRAYGSYFSAQCSKRPPKYVLFGLIFMTYSRFSEYLKSVLPLQSQLDLAGLGSSQNHIFSMFFADLVLSMFQEHFFRSISDCWSKNEPKRLKKGGPKAATSSLFTVFLAAGRHWGPKWCQGPHYDTIWVPFWIPFDTKISKK